MYLLYKKIGFVITLTKKVRFTIPVPFLFRSIIGYQLRKMCCIARNAVCADCMFNASCIYGLTFESIVPKNNIALAGRDRISHPIVIDTDNFAGGTLDSLLLSIIFFGATIPYFPYFYYALIKGGEAGIAKERVPYQISDIVELPASGKGRSLMTDEQKIETGIEPDRWEYSPKTETDIKNKYIIKLLTPLRHKVQGKYAKRIVDAEFAGCLNRRTQILCSQYGGNDQCGDYKFSGSWTVTEQVLKWQDYSHYSARQKKVMRLGGLLGSFTIAGIFSPYEIGFLQFAEKFHGGKNTGFGLGKMKVIEYDGV